MGAKHSPLQDIFNALPELAASMSATPEGREALVVASWRRAAGPMLSERTKARRLRGRHLEVAVADRLWQRQLAVDSPEILSKLNAVLGGSFVDRLEFVIDPDLEKPSANGSGSSRGAVSSLAPELLAAAAAITDAALRDQFLKAASAQSNRKKTS